jgi:hypothetical protein
MLRITSRTKGRYTFGKDIIQSFSKLKRIRGAHHQTRIYWAILSLQFWTLINWNLLKQIILILTAAQPRYLAGFTRKLQNIVKVWIKNMIMRSLQRMMEIKFKKVSLKTKKTKCLISFTSERIWNIWKQIKPKLKGLQPLKIKTKLTWQKLMRSKPKILRKGESP